MTTITRLLPLAILSLVSNFLIGQTRIYVNVAAIGPGDGSSWANAYVDLQEALIAAQYGNEIWVAHGTYYPTLTIDRDIYFSLKNGVKLYGGFAGVESQLSERDWTANETVLSGDIGVLGDSTDNSLHILFIGKSDTTTIVDGFVFRDGNADGTGSSPIQAPGAAIQIFADQFIAAYPKIHNCKFEHNTASFGGAVAILGDNIYGSAGPHFQNCSFRYNSAESQGGAIYRNGHSSLEIKDDFLNCTFENNRGDAIYYRSYNPKKDIFEVVGCNFVSNQGGGIRIDEQSGNKNEGKIEIRDCNFTGNERIMGAGISISAHPLSISIINSSFIGNSSTNILTGNGSAMVIQYNGVIPVGNDSFDLYISQCIFKDNSSNYHQPIISLFGNGSDADVFTNLSFRDNLFEKNADGIVLTSFNSSDISNCIFEGNGTQEDRYILNGYQTDKTVVTNSIFTNNKGIPFREDNSDAMDTISNCTFYNNHSLVDTAPSQLDGSAFISNCIFSQETQGTAFPVEAANVTLENSLILSPDCSALPAFVTCGPGNIFGLEPSFADTAAGDFHLLPTSPGTGAGDNDIVNELGILTDLDGNPRIQGSTVDMGAYESDSGSNNSGVKYVNTNVQGGNNDGTSWANAYLDLQDALAASQYGDEIWVAKGTYYPTTTTDRNISFELKNGVKLYGGFVGTETQLSQRDWVSNETVLSGDIGVLGDSLDNTYNVLYGTDLDSTTLIDGFIVKSGNADNQSPTEPSFGRKKCGGGFYLEGVLISTGIKIMNCSFLNNTATYAGGALFINSNTNKSLSPTIRNCNLKFNHSYQLGGALYYAGGVNEPESSELIIECDIFNNQSKHGSAIYLVTKAGLKAIKVSRTNFSFNSATQLSTFFYRNDIQDSKGLMIEDCDFTNNYALLSSCFYATSSFYNPENIQLKGCNFINNLQECIYFDLNFSGITKTIIDSCYFEGCHANVLQFSGTAIEPYILNSKFYNNFNLNVGAIYSDYDYLFKIKGCVFENNKGKSYGAAVSVRKCEITNSIFKNNSALYGGGELNIFEEGSIVNSVFYEPNNNGNSNPIFMLANTSFSNVIINKADLNAQNLLELNQSYNPDPTIQFSHSLISLPNCDSLPITCGPNMLYNLDPQFVDPDNGDFHLSPCSPARNAGSNAIVDSLGILTDIEGSPRIQGGTVDMGAYESPAFQTASVTATTPACMSGGTGTAALTLENGCPPFFLDWGTGSTISDTSNFSIALPVGTHSITITDGRMESDTVSVTITSSPAITANAVAFPINCANGTGGTASVEAIGGTGNFSFAWANPDGTNAGSTASINGLPIGSYQVTVTDALGCTAVDAVEVLTQGSLTLGINIQPITCPGDSDGTATVQPIGGTMPFAWLWQGGQTTPTIDGLSGGSYAVTVTDALGCTGDLDFTINPPTAIDISFTTVEPDCNGGLGSASATASGGSPGYEFDWDNGANTASVMLPAGPHTVTVTDAHGCTAIETVNLNEPQQLLVMLSTQPPMLCNGASNGSIIINTSGGTMPYIWGNQWENLPAGTYIVTVTDANGCTATATASIAELDEIAVMDTVTDASGPTALDGSIVLTNISGGLGSGYAFLWSNGSTAQNLMGIPTGDYTVTVTDSQGCTGVFSFFVDFGSAAGEAVGNPFGAAIVPNPSSSAGAVLVFEKRSADMRFAVLDALGRVVVAEREMKAERQPLPQGLAPGRYFVVLKNGEGTAVLKWIVTE